jgi:hypothetical protein
MMTESWRRRPLYAAGRNRKYLVVNCINSTNPRFGWTALVRSSDELNVSHTAPLCWDPSLSESVVDAYNVVRPASKAFVQKITGDRIRLDRDSGVMDFGSFKRKVKLIGSFRETDFTWSWQWDQLLPR